MQTNKFHLDNINIQNYKKYNSLDLTFKNQFTLIIGENGSGKTSVLDAIATLLGGYLQAFKDIPTNERHSITKSDVRLEIIDQNNNIHVKYSTPVEISGHCSINEKSVLIKRIRSTNNTNSRTKLSKTDNKNLFDIVKQYEKDETNLLPIISYHGTGRLWGQANLNSSKMEKLTILDGYKDCLNAKSNYRNFISWFKKQEQNSFNLRSEIPILEAVRNTVIELMNELTGKEVELFIYREDDLEIKYKGENIREKISTLSDGYRNVIGIISDIAYRMAILNPGLNLDVNKLTPGIVIIDEIDLHLHPKWQKQIAGILVKLFPKVQFVATSHSPFIIQSQRRDSIIKLNEKDKDHEIVDLVDVDATELSIETITEEIQNIKMPQLSSKKLEMLECAKEYFDKLDDLKNGKISEEEVDIIKARLDQISALYDDNMAYVAFLERQRLVAELNL